MTNPSDSRPHTVEEIETELESNPELSAGLLAGSVDSFIEYFELSGAKVEGVTVRQLA